MKLTKKLTTMVLAVAMVASMSSNVFASDDFTTNELEYTINDQQGGEVLAELVPVNGARTVTYEVTQNYVRLRATPSLSGTILGQLQKGDYVSSINHEEKDADGYRWAYVHSYNHGWDGWVAISYLNPIG